MNETNVLKFNISSQVVIENKRAVGVEFDYDNTAHKVKAKREVILSAGTTNTAQLLMLSGIGPMSELKKFDVSACFFLFFMPQKYRV